MDRSIANAIFASFVLRLATGLTGGLLIYLLADFPSYGGPEVSAAVVGGLTALFFVGELGLSPVFGLLSDRVGYQRVMQLGPVFGVVAVVLTLAVIGPGARMSEALVPMLVGSLPLLGLTRLLEGASTAASVPSVLGYLALASSGDQRLRGRASSWFEAATIAGLAAGLVAAGVLWAAMGPAGFIVNGAVYLGAWWIFQRRVPVLQRARGSPSTPGVRGRYGLLLRQPRVWLLAPTWIALNAALGLYTSQTLFQLVRSPDVRFADQLLVGGLEPLPATAALLIGAVAFFGGLAYWGRRFASVRRTTIIVIGLAGGVAFVIATGLLNHLPADAIALRLGAVGAMISGLFLLAGATPAALGLLADTSESFPADRGAVMGLYSVFLGLGQIVGAVVGAMAAENWALDGVLGATILLGVVAVLPLAHLRRFEIALAEPGSA